MREIVNALFYVNHNGCVWRALPHDFPPWKTCYNYFRDWISDGTWERIHDALREAVRIQEGKQPTPSAAALDSQSVKTGGLAGDAGYDAGKQINGRKRHIVVDTLGLLLVVLVTSAAVQDADGGRLLLPALTPLRCVSPGLPRSGLTAAITAPFWAASSLVPNGFWKLSIALPVPLALCCCPNGGWLSEPLLGWDAFAVIARTTNA
jgi:putative transposase